MQTFPMNNPHFIGAGGVVGGNGPRTIYVQKHHQPPTTPYINQMQMIPETVSLPLSHTPQPVIRHRNVIVEPTGGNHYVIYRNPCEKVDISFRS